MNQKSCVRDEVQKYEALSYSKGGGLQAKKWPSGHYLANKKTTNDSGTVRQRVSEAFLGSLLLTIDNIFF